jgi:hypothetical protein
MYKSVCSHSRINIICQNVESLKLNLYESKKKKVIPVTGRGDPEAPIFSRQMTVRLSALRADRPLPPKKIPGTHFSQRLSLPQGHITAGRITSIEKSNNLIEIEPETFRLLARASRNYVTAYLLYKSCFIICLDLVVVYRCVSSTDVFLFGALPGLVLM